MSSSPFPILDNRPIDKWKVTELKEELKRRRLTTRGLKEELVRRLDEALRVEQEESERLNSAALAAAVAANQQPQMTHVPGGNFAPDRMQTTPVALNQQPQITHVPGGNFAPDGMQTTPIAANQQAEITYVPGGNFAPDRMQTTPVAANQQAEITYVPGSNFAPDRMQTTPVAANQQAEITYVPGGNFAPDRMQTTPVSLVGAPFSFDTIPSAAETTPQPTEVKTTTEASAAIETTPPPVFSKPDVSASGFDDIRDVAGLDSSVVDVKLQEPKEASVKGSGMTATDAVVVAEEASNEQIIQKSDVEMEIKETFSGLDSNAQTEAVLEKSATQNQVSEVIPVSGFEVKSDCISTDCVSNNEKIELKDNEIADNVKLEPSVNKSQEPSTVLGESHPMDVEKPLEQKISVGGGDDSDAANADMSKGNNIIDAGDSEKLNLDRSSGDESMEDEPETKQTESVTSHEVVDKSEKTDLLPDKADGMDAGKGESPEIKNHPLVTSDKRKLPVNDQEAVGNNEPAKRQRRWNSGNIKVPEAQGANNATPTTTPRSTGLKRDFSRSDSSISEDGPKERVVPPSPKEPTNSLRIDRFLRPFTLKAVQELLGKTGNVTSFWMDHIKTHCYVSYSSVEEAAATREAVYNLQWPPNGGRLLTAEFVGPEEVKAKLEAPPPKPQPQPQAQAPSRQPQAQAPSRLPPTALPPPPPLAKAPPVIERVPLPPPPPLVPEDQEPPIVTLDDLFKKTKAIPRIYYLPLSEDQAAAKLAANNK